MNRLNPASPTVTLAALAALALSPAIARAQPATPPPPAPPTPAAPADASLWTTRSDRFGGYEWITRPSQDSILTFGGPVETRRILARGGDRVRQGQIVIQGRDDEQQAALEVQRVRATDRSDVLTAEASLELAQSRFDAAEEAKAKEAINPSEYDERRIGLKAAKIALQAAEQRFKEEGLRLKQIEEQIKRFRLEAPFDGIVQEVMAELGQTTDERGPVIRIINIDPLYIDVPVRIDQTITLNLQPGKPAWLLLDVPGEPVVLNGKVLYVAPGADSASGTRRVRVEAANPAQLPSGTRARVRFTQPADGWAELPPAVTTAQATAAEGRR